MRSWSSTEYYYESKETSGWRERLASRLFPIHSVNIACHLKSHEAFHRVLIKKEQKHGWRRFVHTESSTREQGSCPAVTS